jgi:hypothetical protein
MTRWTGDDAKQVLAEIERIAALQAGINAADLSPSDPCKKLLTAACAVVEAWDRWMASISPNRPTVRDLETVIDALREAVEAADGEG